MNLESAERAGKIQKFEYLETENSILDEIRDVFKAAKKHIELALKSIWKKSQVVFKLICYFDDQSFHNQGSNSCSFKELGGWSLSKLI